MFLAVASPAVANGKVFVAALNGKVYALQAERVAAIAVERGFARVEWAVLDWNESAIAFYRSLGAAPVDGWTRYRWAPATGSGLPSARLASETRSADAY